MSHKYSVEVTEEQAKILIRALDLFTRIGLGQYEEIIHLLRDELPEDPKEQEARVGRIAEALQHLRDAKFLITGHTANGSYGLSHPKVKDDYRIAYDLEQVVRNRLAWDENPKGGIQVQFDPPRQTSATHPIASIKKV